MALATARSSGRSALGLLLTVVVAVLLWWSQGDGGDPTGAATDAPSARPSASHDYTATATPTSEPSAPSDPGATDPESGLPLVRLGELPAEARDVLERIDAGGPFEFPEHDGGIFENREGLLPDRARGHYREYTVDDGVGDRGPLRIVAGVDGERYWTDDHYRSFSRVELDG